MDPPCPASEKAARELAAMGYDNVRDYAGGKQDWLDLVEEGRIAEHGPHTSLLASGGRYAGLYHRQFREPAAAAGG